VSSIRHLLTALVVVALFSTLAAAPAAAQYGGVSGLFVITSPDEPGVADFSGLGCSGGDEVVLYLPGIPPTASDPAAATSVPGRVIAVTTAVSSADPLVDGTFSFRGVRLPTDLEPGFYAFHARCGTLDLLVVLEITAGGDVVVTPQDEIDDVRDQIVNPPSTLPFTGRESSRLVSLAAALVVAGAGFVVVARRRSEDDATV
jgi:hypothetical protein